MDKIAGFFATLIGAAIAFVIGVSIFISLMKLLWVYILLPLLTYVVAPIAGVCLVINIALAIKNWLDDSQTPARPTAQNTTVPHNHGETSSQPRFTSTSKPNPNQVLLCHACGRRHPLNVDCDEVQQRQHFTAAG